MTRCNYCTLYDIWLLASVADREVYVVPLDSRNPIAEKWSTAVEVYTVSKGGTDYTWVAMMLALPERCVC